jgi:hypothetical protein
MIVRTLPQDVVGHLERVRERSALLDHLQEPVVLDHDQRVHLVGELEDPLLCLLRAPPALELERPGDDAHRERVELAGDLGDDGSGAGAGAATLAGGDEDHVGALQRLLQLVAALHPRGVADGRIRARTETAGRLRTDVDLHVGVAHEQRLRVGVHCHELDPCERGVDHAVDCIRPAAADADDLDHSQVVAGTISHLDGTRPQAVVQAGAACRLLSPGAYGRSPGLSMQ